MPHTIKPVIHCHLCRLLRVWAAMLCVAAGTFTTDARELSRHYIVAFDDALPAAYADAYRQPSTLAKVWAAISRQGFDPHTDAISVVGYSIQTSQPLMADFVRPYTDPQGQPVVMRSLNISGLEHLFPGWPEGRPDYRGQTGSMQSIAKEYIISEMAPHAGDKAFDRTYLVMVTDEAINGMLNTFAQEWDRLSSAAGSDTQQFKRLEPQVSTKVAQINEEFKFERIPVADHVIATYFATPYQVALYEAVPAERPSIHSATDLPSPLPLRRVRGGFRLDAQSATRSDRYQLRAISLTSASGQLLGEATDGRFDTFIPSDKISAGDTVEIRMDLRLHDGFYNAALISAQNPRYASGMTLRQSVRIQDDARILGLMPITDGIWWWFPDDALSAVLVWDMVILLLVIALVAFVFYRIFIVIITYRPGDDAIKITKI